MNKKCYSYNFKRFLLTALSLFVCICFVSIILCACEQNHDGTYTLVDMSYSDGKICNLFNSFNGTTLKITGTDATVYYPKHTRDLPIINISPGFYYSNIPESSHLTIFWETWTCFSEADIPMSFSCYDNNFIIESDGIIWHFKK